MTAGVSNSLIIENRLGVGVTNPDAAVEVSSLTTTDIHVDGGQGASLTLDADTDLHTSDINFSLDGVTRGNIKYTHDEDGLSEEMIFYTSGTVTPLIFNSDNQLVIGGQRTHNSRANLEVVGSVIIGGTYSNSESELTSGLLVEGRVGIGTNSIQTGIQMAVNGAIAAGAYHGETAPANGFIISGASAFGTNNPNGNHQLTVSSGGLCVGDDVACNGTVGSEGNIYAAITSITGVDYAEYFPADEILSPGQLVGINVQSGKTRAYRNGDTFLGVISTKPGVVGGWTRDSKTHNLVGLMGQLPFSRSETLVKKGKVYTKDQKLIGTLLSTGDIYLNGFSGDDSKPLIKEMKKLRNMNKALEERLNIQENKILDLRKKLNFIIQRLK